MNFYTYACDTPRYRRKGNPNAWITVDKANRKMFQSYPVFSFPPGSRGDEEPIRFGDFVIDIDTECLACPSALKIIDWFEQIYSVDPEQWRIYLSGKKGVHLELAASIMGLDDGHTLLPAAYKRLAVDIEGEVGVKLDLSMYNNGTGKPYRRPNIMRECGTCKRQIEYNNLFEITTKEEYIVSCSEPGDTWNVKDVSLNFVLADRVKQYLKLAEEAVKTLASTPKLSESQINALSSNLPPCIKKLAKLTEASSGATFNDIAIQLTAYAISSGVTEDAFLAGCRVFIEGYPSSSLDTIEKRQSNVRERYRNMTANGYRHSCGGILALKVGGYNCDWCPIHAINQTVEVMSAEDVEQEELRLTTPLEGIELAGLVKTGVQALTSCGLAPIPQYALPVVLTIIARVISGKITCNNIWPNIYNVKVGPTSSGKTDADRALFFELKKNGLDNLIGITEIASGAGLLRALAEDPVTLFTLDEATGLFRNYDKRDPVTDGKKDVLMEVFSSSGRTIKKSYGNSKSKICVENPCLTFIGNSTPNIFESIKIEDFHSGLMPRFDFFCYDGKLKYREHECSKNNDLEKFVRGIVALYNVDSQVNKTKIEFNKILNPIDIGFTPKCKKLSADFSKKITDELNVIESESPLRGTISRKYHGSIKYAMIFAAGNRRVEDLFEPLTEKELQWGIAIVNMLGDWKAGVLDKKIVSGDFHRDCEIFKDAIHAAIKCKTQRPTFGLLASRRRALKNWKPGYSENIITVLHKRGEIILDDSKPKTAYFLPK